MSTVSRSRYPDAVAAARAPDVGSDDIDVAVNTAVFEALFKSVEVVGKRWVDEGVYDGRDCTFVFPIFGENLAREAHV